MTVYSHLKSASVIKTTSLSVYGGNFVLGGTFGPDQTVSIVRS